MRFNWLLLLLPLSVSAQQKIPDNRISESSVTQHQSALTVTESQISDLSHTTDTNASTQCATGLVLGGAADGCISPGGAESNDLTAAVTWANVPDANITEGSVTQHQAALTVTESQVSDLSHTTDTDTQLTQEQVEDFAGALVTDGTGTRTGIALTYQDATGDIDAVVDHDTAANFDVAEHFTQGAISITESQISDLTHTTDTFVTNKDSHDHVGGDGAALTITESQISDLSHTTDTDTQLTQEQVEDFAGGMDLGTETRVSFTYNDTSGNFDIVVDDMNQTSGDIDHDATTNFLAAEHVDWAGVSAGTIHATNYVDNDTTDHTALSNIGTNTHAQIDTHIATPGHTTTVAGITDLDNDAATLSLPASTTITATGASIINDATMADVRTTIGVDAAGTDNSTDVTLSGTPDYLTIAGQAITLGTVDISDDTNLAGTANEITLTGDTLSIHADIARDSELINQAEKDFIIETATTSDDLRVKANGAITLTGLDCIATGATTPSAQIVTVMECTSAGATCVSSGYTVTVAALTTNYNDATGTDSAIDDNDWWGLDTTSLTTAADLLHCTVTYTYD